MLPKEDGRFAPLDVSPPIRSVFDSFAS